MAEYTTQEQNKREVIVQNFGRFFHSPLYFNTQLPYFGTIALAITGGGAFSILEDNADATTDTIYSIENDGTSSYFCIDTEVSSILNLYSPYVSPNCFIDDNTQYRLVPCISDSSVLIRVYYSTGSTFSTWYDTGSSHPFVSDSTFFVSFYGKRV